MKHEFEKNMRIMTDLLIYCHELGAADYHIDMGRESDGYHCCITCSLAGIPDKVLSELERALNIPRQKEIEQNFWGLSGEVATDTELTLVGMMIDEATVTYENDALVIRCMRAVGG